MVLKFDGEKSLSSSMSRPTQIDHRLLLYDCSFLLFPFQWLEEFLWSSVAPLFFFVLFLKSRRHHSQKNPCEDLVLGEVGYSTITFAIGYSSKTKSTDRHGKTIDFYNYWYTSVTNPSAAIILSPSFFLSSMNRPIKSHHQSQLLEPALVRNRTLWDTWYPMLFLICILLDHKSTLVLL
jgi:hypothetical protein